MIFYAWQKNFFTQHRPGLGKIYDKEKTWRKLRAVRGQKPILERSYDA